MTIIRKTMGLSICVQISRSYKCQARCLFNTEIVEIKPRSTMGCVRQFVGIPLCYYLEYIQHYLYVSLYQVSISKVYTIYLDKSKIFHRSHKKEGYTKYLITINVLHNQYRYLQNLVNIEIQAFLKLSVQSVYPQKIIW